MAWTYQQSTGILTDPSGTVQGKGYSGQPPHTNNPESQVLHNLGPIPRGYWHATGVEEHTQKHGPFVVVLEPYPNTNVFERSDFRIHGERVEPPPGYASEGCIIVSRDVRELFWQSTDHDLQVIE